MLFCNSAPVHGGESWAGGQDRVGPRAGGAPGPGRRHQDMDGPDNLPDWGFTAAQPRWETVNCLFIRICLLKFSAGPESLNVSSYNSVSLDSWSPDLNIATLPNVIPVFVRIS